MSRYPLHTVTFPVLVDAAGSVEEPDGWGTCFPSPARTKFMAVRVVKAEDLQERVRKVFPPKEISLFVGANQLKRAYDTKDFLALQQSLEKVRPRVPTLGAGNDVAWNLGSSSEPNWVGARWIYSSLMSNLLQGARLVMWCSDKEGAFLPGVYCPDWKTAAFVMAFMEHIRVCPKCSNPFIPESENQDYCSPAHGVAYRTARSRWRAQQRAGEEKKATKKKGPKIDELSARRIVTAGRARVRNLIAVGRQKANM